MVWQEAITQNERGQARKLCVKEPPLLSPSWGAGKGHNVNGGRGLDNRRDRRYNGLNGTGDGDGLSLTGGEGRSWPI
jgi:hypothetical protein